MRHRLEQVRPLVTASYLEAKVKADIPGSGPPRLSCPHSLPYSVAVSTGSTTAVGCAVTAALVPGTQLMSHPPVKSLLGFTRQGGHFPHPGTCYTLMCLSRFVSGQSPHWTQFLPGLLFGSQCLWMYLLNK